MGGSAFSLIPEEINLEVHVVFGVVTKTRKNGRQVCIYLFVRCAAGIEAQGH